MEGNDKYICKGICESAIIPCLIEEKVMKVNGEVDEKHFVFSASSRGIGDWSDLWLGPLNIRKMDAVPH